MTALVLLVLALGAPVVGLLAAMAGGVVGFVGVLAVRGVLAAVRRLVGLGRAYCPSK